ncbi:MAG: hypothetical protein ACK2UK_16380 [Candidatus Promineifilaceae bacterium]
MSKYERNTVIVAVFENESAAAGAQAGLEHWDGTRRDVKLGSIGFLQIEDGEVKSTLVRKENKGILVNGAMGLVRSMLGPIAVVGDVVGGVAKSFLKNDAEETPLVFQQLSAFMDAGGVTMILVAEEAVAQAHSRQLQAMGGRVTTHIVPQEVLEEVDAALQEAEAQAKDA